MPLAVLFYAELQSSPFRLRGRTRGLSAFP